MKPLILTMQAFGPYADKQVIDFSTLNQAGLFLITGPTGSGKTTILDAISYALYGETSGGSRSAEQLRSDHTDPGLPTEVTLDFQVKDKTYRVHRLPQQVRPKKRGEGFTDQASRAWLWDRTGISGETDEGHPLASRSADVTSCCEEILGFKIDQFRQVVTLPQGKFREFLDASSDAREQVLEALFQTHRFRKIQEALKEKHNSLRRSLDEMRRETATRLNAVDMASEEELKTAIASLDDEKAERERQVETLKTAADAARDALDTGRREVRVLTELEDAQNDVSGLEKMRPEIADKRLTLERAQKASRIADTDKALEDARENLEEVVAEIAAAEDSLQEAEETLEEATETYEQNRLLKAKREELQREITLLKPAKNKLISAEKYRSTLRALEADRENHVSRQRDNHDEAAGLRRKIEDMTAEASEAAKIAGLLGTREGEVRAAQKVIDQLTELSELEHEKEKAIAAVTQAISALETAEDSLLQAQGRLSSMRRSNVEAQASFLAATLVAGEPCPVCGSLNHPQPAADAPDAASQAEIEAAESEVLELEKERRERIEEVSAAKASLSAVNAAIESLSGQMGEYSEVALSDATRELNEKQKETDRSKAAQRLADKLHESIASSHKRLAALKSELDDVSDTLHSIEISIGETRTAIEKDFEGTPQGIGSVEDLDALIASKENELKRLDREWDDAQKALEEADKAVLESKTTLKGLQGERAKAEAVFSSKKLVFAERLQEAGFTDANQYRRSLVDEDDINEIAEKIAGYEKQLAAAYGRLQRARVAANGLKTPDLEGLEKAFETADNEHGTAQIELAGVQSRMNSLTNVKKKLTALKRKHNRAEKQWRLVGRVSEAVNGGNQRRMTLQRYVLATMLESVLSIANVRLNQLSSGRYELMLGDAAEDHRRAGGLELNVFDEWTGEKRAVRTLSGGESFLAALALANALSESVQSFAGGIQLDTVFIDEGFGSLDSEALDSALNSLLESQGPGRLTGIISHVQELKERIPTRLEVSAGRKGSSARFVL